MSPPTVTNEQSYIRSNSIPPLEVEEVRSHKDEWAVARKEGKS